MSGIVREKCQEVMDLIDMIIEVFELGLVSYDYARQTTHKLLQTCTSAALVHLARTTPPTVTKPHFRRVDRHLARAVYLLATDKTCSDEWLDTVEGQLYTTRLTLPCRHGGLGYMSLERTCEAAYAGSLLLVCPIIKDRHFLTVGGEASKPTSANGLGNTALPHLAQIIADGLFTGVPGLGGMSTTIIWANCGSPDEEGREEEVGAVKGLAKGQAILSEFQHQKLAKTVLDSIPSPELKAAWLSQSAREAAAPFAVFTHQGMGGKIGPNGKNIAYALDDITFKIGLQRRLGLPALSFDGTRTCGAQCNKIFTNTGEHAFTCRCTELRALPPTRHKVVLGALYRKRKIIARAGGFSTVEVEPNMASLGCTAKADCPPTLAASDAARGDILISKDGGHKYILDLVIPHPTSNIPYSSTKPGAAAEKAVKTKLYEYNRKFNIPANVEIVPIAIETGDRWHKDSLAWVKSFCKLAYTEDGNLDRVAYNSNYYDLQVLAQVALQRCVARAIITLDDLAASQPGASAAAAAAAAAAEAAEWGQAVDSQDQDEDGAGST